MTGRRKSHGKGSGERACLEYTSSRKKACVTGAEKARKRRVGGEEPDDPCQYCPSDAAHLGGS